MPVTRNPELFDFGGPVRGQKRGSRRPASPPPSFYVTENPEEANYQVCFVDLPQRAKNEHLIEGYVRVASKQDADLILYVTENESQADICIYRATRSKERTR